MSPRRPRKPAPAEVWILKPASRTAQRQWEDAVSAQPELMHTVRERLRTRPLDRSDNPNRTHRLKPPLHEHLVGTVKLPQWQYEMTAGGRVWYCPDHGTRTLWITKVSFDPPKETHRP